MRDYNESPKHLRDIDLKEWQDDFFSYCLPEPDARQVHEPERFDLRLFYIENKWTKEEIGIGVKRVYEYNGKGSYNPIITFCKFGSTEDWETFYHKFAAQFAGDNS